LSQSPPLLPTHLLPRLKGQARHGLEKGLSVVGFGLTKLDAPGSPAHRAAQQQRDLQRQILERHDRQSIADVEALNDRYRTPVFGSVRPMDLFLMLGECLDPTDNLLGCASQLTHSLQVIEAMRCDGVLDDDLLLLALLHDLGKLLLLSDEDPANVVGTNRILTPKGSTGLDQHITQWNHCEFGYMRFQSFLPSHLCWTIRYHGLKDENPIDYMDATDNQYFHGTMKRFRHYDKASKSLEIRPVTKLSEYRNFVETRLPERIVF
jgi:predicted HD phosphohydrolase